MKTFLLSVASVLILSTSAIAQCDCTITPYKPDPPCFMVCVSKALASASYAELTGKYGLSGDIAQRIINAREKQTDTSTGWYTKSLSGADITHVDAKFSALKDNSSSNDSRNPYNSTTTTTTTTTTKPPE